MQKKLYKRLKRLLNIVKKKQEILNNYLEKLSKIFTLRLVILFGSFVRED